MDNEIKMDENRIIALIFSFFIPPLGVAIKEGFSASFFINCLLTLLGFFPGLIHAVYVILCH